MIKFIPMITKIIERFAAKHPLIYKLTSIYYKNLVKEEVTLANIKSIDKVLCIGGGPCPYSGILLHEYTSAHVTIVDNDCSSVDMSRVLIQNLGYTNTIEVIHNDGSNISPKNYDVIHMAVQVSPLDQVFGHIKGGCNSGAKILMRLPKKSLTSFYSISDQSRFHNYYEKAEHSWRNVGTTALYVNIPQEC